MSDTVRLFREIAAKYGVRLVDTDYVLTESEIAEGMTLTPVSELEVNFDDMCPQTKTEIREK